MITVPTTNANFTDLAFGHKNAEAIRFLQDTNVIGGYADGTFKPGNNVNRAELAKILVEAQGITPDADEYNNCFPDVTDEWFAPYVCYAKEMEWVSGYPDGTFRPEKTVLKVEAIKMVINSQGFENELAECNAKAFSDTEENAWYSRFLCVAKEKGLLEEDENGNYVPAEGMTRGGVAENIYRSIMIRKLNHNAFSDEIKSQVEEVKNTFKEERQAVRSEIQAMRAELKQMREDERSEEEIQAARQSFWEEIKTAQKENRQNFASQMKEIHQEFVNNRKELRSKFAECKEEGLVYRVDSDSCEERCNSAEGENTCKIPLRKKIRNSLNEINNGQNDESNNDGDDDSDSDTDEVDTGTGTNLTGTGTSA